MRSKSKKHITILCLIITSLILLTPIVLASVESIIRPPWNTYTGVFLISICATFIWVLAKKVKENNHSVLNYLFRISLFSIFILTTWFFIGVFKDYKTSFNAHVLSFLSWNLPFDRTWPQADINGFFSIIAPIVILFTCFYVYYTKYAK